MEKIKQDEPGYISSMWIKVMATENFIKYRSKKRGGIFPIATDEDLLFLCEHFKERGYQSHLGGYSWDAEIIFERIKPI